MDMTTGCDTLIRIMNEEIHLLKQFCDAEAELKDYIQTKDWGKLQESIENINPLSVSLSLVEKERERHFKKFRKSLGVQGETSFYAIINHVPPPQREKLASAYRQLKVFVLKVQGITRSIESIAASLSSTIQKVVEELFPYKKGKIYNTRGRAKDVYMNPLVLNRQL